MTPHFPSVAQLLVCYKDVAALGDSTVLPCLPGGAFGSAADPGVSTPVDYTKLYVDVRECNGEMVYVVLQYFKGPPSDDPIMTFGDMTRWMYARPLWGCKADLPDLATAVAMARLPDSEFPQPGEYVQIEGASGTLAILNSDVVIGTRVPLWRVLKQLGKLG